MVLRLFVCVLIIQGCFPRKAQTPEEVLREYITYRFSSGQTKEKLLDFTTGETSAKVESLTEDQFRRYTNTGIFRLNNIKVLLKSCRDKACSITYILSFSRIKGETLLNEIKKVAEFELVEGSWKIKDVSTVKTYFESRLPIDVH